MEIKDCIILMGGLGTRCYPFSYTLPKCMVPILNKPIIQYIVEDVMEAGYETLYIVLPKFNNSRVCIQHFKQNKKVLKLLKEKNSLYYQQIISRKFPKIVPVYSKKPNGSGGAVLNCQKYLKGKTFAVVNGDDLFIGKSSAMKELTQYAIEQNSFVVTDITVPVEDGCKFGMFKLKEENDKRRVIEIIEKPQNNTELTQANVGRYILNSDIFKLLKKLPKRNGEIYLSEAVSEFAKNHKVLCKSVACKRYDCGSVEGILQASNCLFDMQNNK